MGSGIIIFSLLIAQKRDVIRTEDIAVRLAPIYAESIYAKSAANLKWRAVIGKRYSFVELVPPEKRNFDVVLGELSMILQNDSGGLYRIAPSSLKGDFRKLEKISVGSKPSAKNRLLD